jgi:eukaryotic-like serine/threonine-protein kinase
MQSRRDLRAHGAPPGGMQSSNGVQSTTRAPVRRQAPAPGLRIGDYELVRSIGKGGMGEVFLARDLTLGRRVAVKFLAIEADELWARRFLVEARATARCVHDNIVVIHEVASWQGLPYMVLEYLDGEPLAAQLARGPLPPGRVIDVMIPVARALTGAHAAAIIHRDLKPDNIFLTRQGSVKVLDFGIAKLLVADDAATHRDLATLEEADHGRVVGTGPYMAPEQWAGGVVDARSDVYALGVIAYRALTGRHPSGAATDRAIERETRDAARAFPSLAVAAPRTPPGLVAIIDRCLAKPPERRFQTAAELLRALEAQRPRERPRGAAGADDACPYPGLAGFTEADADRYFGRAQDIERARQLLQSRTVLAVIGQSGSGKSSFALAGVAAGLRTFGEGWEVVAHRPGPQPLRALVGELRRRARDRAGAARPVAARVRAAPRAPGGDDRRPVRRGVHARPARPRARRLRGRAARRRRR